MDFVKLSEQRFTAKKFDVNKKRFLVMTSKN